MTSGSTMRTVTSSSPTTPGRIVLHALALETQHLTRARPLGDRELNAPPNRRHLDLRPEHRLVDRDRQLEEDVVVLALEIAMRPDADLDQRIARLPAGRARLSPPAQAQHLTVVHPFRHVEIEHAAVRHRDALLCALHALDEVDLERVAHVAAARREAAASRFALPLPPEKMSEKMSPKSSKIGPPRPRAPRAGPGMLACRVAARLAHPVDLAVVELPAPLRIAEDVVRRRHLLEALLGGPRRVDVGMQLLDELEIGAPNILVRGACAGRLGFDTDRRPWIVRPAGLRRVDSEVQNI